MKTTVDLPKTLLIAAKKRAAKSGTTLKAILEAALRSELARDRPQSARRRRPIHWVTVKGGLPPGYDLTDRSQWAGRSGKG
jgi:hypothetical protein